MTNKMTVFQNEELKANIRVVEINGQPYFVAKDVCDALDISNSRDAITRLDDDEKGVGLIYTPGGKQEMKAVNEAGLYNLILGSRKPEAKQFKRWITHDVLPSIRKTGKYELPQIAPHPKYKTRLLGTAIKDIGITSKMLQEVFHVNEGLALSKATVLVEMTYQVDLSPVKELLPAAEHDVGSLTPTQLGKMISDISARAVNKTLVSLGFQIKVGNGYELTEAGKEYGEMVPFTAPNGKHTGYQPKWNTKVLIPIKDYKINTDE